MSLQFSSPLGPVKFADPVLDVFHRNRQMKPWSREAGGQLFCRFDGDTIIVEHATGPRSDDKRSRYSFWPNRKREQEEINQLFSDGLHYVGDWHTHPEDIPTPSGEDTKKMQAIFQESDHHLKRMFLVVVGRNPSALGLWVGLISQQGILEATEAC